MNNALRKLRIKFVAIIMAVVAVILAVVFSAIVAISYNNSTTEVYDALDSAIEHDTLEMRGPFDKMRPEGGDALFDEEPRFEIGGREPEQSLIPVAVYQLDAAGSMTLASSAASGAMAESVLDDTAAQAAALPLGHGFIDSLGVYYAKEIRGGETYIAFADERSVSQWRSLALMLVGIGLGALALFFVVSLIFSKWALRPVEASWKQQQRFIADASHELKTPLTVMAADVAILKRNSEASIASQSQWVESIEGEIDSMRELVGDMLLLARADAQEETALAGTTSVDLSKLVNVELLQFEPIAYERALEFDASVASGVEIQGDRDKLQRLVSVLLDNAFKYVNDGGHIAVGLSTCEDSVVLTISNSGGFIPAEDLPHVFDRFYRTDKARARTGELSYGLGLSIASEIAHLHGGTIMVASTESSGTTFTVTLPL